MLPEVLQDDDGDFYFGQGHIEPHRFVLAMVQDYFVCVGAREAMEMLFGDDGTIRQRQGISDERKAHAAELIASVEHLWGYEDPIDEERWHWCTASHPDARPYTRAAVR
jgi:hypothetical protein